MSEETLNPGEAQFEVVYTPAFGGGVLEGPGRWFESDYGLVWTDDAGHLNLLDYGFPQESKAFREYKTALESSGLDATEAFNLMFNAIQEDDPEFSFSEGDLTEVSKEYNAKMTPKEPDPLTAAAPTEDDLKETASFGLTLDEDDSTVLELVKSDENGVYVRENETWVQLDPEADEDANPTVYGAIWYDVGVDAIPVFDDGEESDLTKEDFAQFIVE